MWFPTLPAVVVGLFLCTVMLERWTMPAAGDTPTWLTAPDTIRKEAVLWEGVLMPFEEVQRRVATLEAELKAAQRTVAVKEVTLAMETNLKGGGQA